MKSIFQLFFAIPTALTRHTFAFYCCRAFMLRFSTHKSVLKFLSYVSVVAHHMNIHRHFNGRQHNDKNSHTTSFLCATNTNKVQAFNALESFVSKSAFLWQRNECKLAQMFILMDAKKLMKKQRISFSLL